MKNKICKIRKSYRDFKSKGIISLKDFENSKIFKKYIESISNDSKEFYTITRIDESKLFAIGNIKLKIKSHNKIFLNREYKWCTKCERYIQNNKNFWLKENISPCNKCRLHDKLKRKFNLTYIEYLNLIKSKRCEICKTNISFSGNYKTGVIDHCHKENKVRGILCRKCNNALGLFKDNKKILIKTIDYLNRKETNIKYNKINRSILIDTICPITGYLDNLVCDHNHKTGYIRGNIYNYINLAIGLFKDSIENLENAIKYLEKAKS